MYIPKSRIKPNLYTRGDEYMLISNNENYIGFYHSLWNGKFFTGKTQNDSNIREITPVFIPEGEDIVGSKETIEPENILALLKPHAPELDIYNFSQQDILTYPQLQRKSTVDLDLKKLPFQSYPKPTEDNYQLGSFTRYFTVKVNELQYLELNLPSYTKLKKKDNNWMWEMYIIFSLQWTLTGEQEEVARTNRNQILIAEKQIKRLGFDSFLRRDYLKFYQES